MRPSICVSQAAQFSALQPDARFPNPGTLSLVLSGWCKRFYMELLPQSSTLTPASILTYIVV
jgi:hypothetical protein